MNLLFVCPTPQQPTTYQYKGKKRVPILILNQDILIITLAMN